LGLKNLLNYQHLSMTESIRRADQGHTGGKPKLFTSLR